MQLRKFITLLVVALLMSASSAVSAATFNNPQTKPADPLSGKYEGVAKGEAIGELPITLEVKNEAGKLTGKIDSPQGPAPITSGTYMDGKVTMKLDAGGNELLVTGMFKDDKIVGEWEMGGQKGTFELKKAGTTAAAPAPKKEEAKASATDPVTGDWEASADAQGTSIPFRLKLKLEGDKVTGSSESAQGALAISKGSFAGDKLSITLNTPDGQAIVLTGVIKDNKIAGEFDFAGQFTGKWEAKKK